MAKDFLSDEEMQNLEGDFISDEQMSAIEPSIGQTVVGKLASGASLGFVDELAGGLEAGGAALGLKGLGGKLKDIGLSGEGPTLDYDTLKKAYQTARDKERASQKAMSEANPVISGASEIAGSLATAPLGGAATLAGRVGAAAGLGAVSGLGRTEAPDAQGMLLDTAIGGATGAALQGVGEKVISPLVSRAGDALLKARDPLLQKAVGATGTQASKFQKGAGEEMSNYIKFGDNPAKIANRLEAAKEAAGQNISTQLGKLDEMGVSASVDDIVSALETKVAELKKVAGNENTIKQIEKTIKQLYERGESSIPLSAAEQAKRNYQSMVNYFSPEAEKKGATFAADAFRQEVEKKAAQASPEAAKSFMESKKIFGLLSPIEEAAQKRAAQQGASSFGNFSDMTAAAAGAAAGGSTGAALGYAAKNVVIPRLGSAAFVTADRLGYLLSKNPQAFGKWSGALASAASRGQEAFNVTHHILQQTDEDYRKLMRKLTED